MLKLYLGHYKEIRTGVLAIEKFVEWNIAYGEFVPLETWGDLVVTKGSISKATVDIEPTDLFVAAKEAWSDIYSRPSLAMRTQVETINLFTAPEESSILPISITVVRDNSNNVQLCLGKFSENAYISTGFYGAGKTAYLIARKSYPSLEAIVQDMTETQRAYEEGTQEVWYLNSLDIAPIWFYSENTTTYAYDSIRSSDINLPGAVWDLAPFLARADGWSVALNGKHLYGDPWGFELQEVVNGIDRITFGVTTGITRFDIGADAPSGLSPFISYQLYTPATRLGLLAYNVEAFPYSKEVFFKESTDSILIEQESYTSDMTVTFKTASGNFAFTFNRVNDVMLNINGILEKDLGNPQKWAEIMPGDPTDRQKFDIPLQICQLWKSDYKPSDITESYGQYLYLRANGTNVQISDTQINYTYEFWRDLLKHVKYTAVPGFDPGEGSLGGGYVSGSGGGGSYDDSSDAIIAPGDNDGIGGLANFCKIFRVDKATLDKVGWWLTSNEAVFADKANGVISCKNIWYPIGIPHSASDVSIRIAGATVQYDGADVAGQLCTKQFVSYEWSNKLTLEEYFGSFLDYEPYTQIKIFLPFVGFKELNVAEVMGGTISLQCVVDILSGTLNYNISVEKDGARGIRYSFAGDCTYEIPVSSTDYSGKVLATRNAVFGMVIDPTVALLQGNTLQAGLSVVSNITGLANALSQRVSYSRSGSIAGNVGIMNYKAPFLLVTRPKMALPETFASQHGFKSGISAILNELTGYTKVAECHLEGIPATETELNEIDELLKSGVII